MARIDVIWSGKPSHKRVLLVRFEGRKWRYRENWKFSRFRKHWNIILPFLRFTKCNTSLEIGLGNHYLIIGWQPQRREG